MKPPFARLDPTSRRRTLVVLAFLFALTSAGLLWIDAALFGRGLVDLELTADRSEVVAIVTGWAGAGDLHLAAFGLGLDMAYLLVYGALGALLAQGASGRAARRGRAGLARLAALGAWAVPVASAFDVAENSLQIPILGNPAAGVPAAVVACATTKFVLLGAALVAAVAAAVAPAAGRRPAGDPGSGLDEHDLEAPGSVDAEGDALLDVGGT